jgi:hypothetical protein
MRLKYEYIQLYKYHSWKKKSWFLLWWCYIFDKMTDGDTRCKRTRNSELRSETKDLSKIKLSFKIYWRYRQSEPQMLHWHFLTNFLMEDGISLIISKCLHVAVLVEESCQYSVHVRKPSSYLYSESNIRVQLRPCERGLLYLSPSGCRVWCSLEVLKRTPANTDERRMLNVVCFTKTGWRS